MGDHRGGISRLLTILAKHRGPLEADLLRYYRVDLLDLHRGTLTHRRLLRLVAALPVDSATAAAMNGGIAPMTRAELIADEARRDAVMIATGGKTRPEALPGSPLHISPEQKAAEARKRREDHEAAESRDAARQARLAAKAEAEAAERPHLCDCGFRAKTPGGLASHRRRHAARKEDQ